MTLTLFITLVTILSTISSLITQAIKKITNTLKPTIVVAIVSAVCGWIGGVMAYILMGISFNPSSIVCLILLAPTIFLTATLGYDKVMEIIKQLFIKLNK
jgi:hypothetical protein